MKNFEYYGDINSIHYSIMDRENYINTTYGNGSYDVYVSQINSYKDVIEQLERYDKPLYFDPIPNRTKHINEVNIIRQAISGNGLPLIGFDTEVIGLLQEATKNTPKQNSLFAVTEVGFAKLDSNGVSPIEEMSMNLPISAGKDLADKTTKIKKASKAYLNGEALGEYEEAASSVTVNNRIRFYINKENGVLTEKDIINGIDEINRRGGILNVNNKNNNMKKITDKIKNMHDELERMVNEGYPIIGHNINKADIPWINELFTSNGLSEIDFSKTNVIDTLDLLNDTISYKLYDIYSKEGLSESERMRSLESLKTLIGAKDTLSHMAANDISINLKLFNEQLPNSQKTILDFITETLNEKKDVVNKNGLLYSTKAIYNNDKSLSFLSNEDGDPEIFRSYATERGSYYTIDSVGYISKDKYDSLTKQMPWLEEYMPNKEGYVMTLRQYTGSENQGMFPTISNIYANSIDELNNILSDHFIPSKINDNVDNNIEINAKDKARRKFESFFEQTPDSYQNAKKYYETFNLLKEKGLDKENVKQLFVEGQTTVNGKVISFNDLFGKGYYENHMNSNAKKRDFYYMYDSLADTTDIITPIINNIEDSYSGASGKPRYSVSFNKQKFKEKIAFDKYGKHLSEIDATSNPKIGEELNKLANKEYWAEINIAKGRALAISFEDISNQIKEFHGNPYILEIDNANTDFLKTYGSVKVNDEYRNINLSSKESTFRGLFNLVYSNKDYKLQQNTDLLRKDAFKEIVKNLNERGINIGNYENVEDIYTALQGLSEELYKINKEDSTIISPTETKTFGDRVLVKEVYDDNAELLEEHIKLNEDDLSFSKYVQTYVSKDLDELAKSVSEKAMDSIDDVTNAFFTVPKDYSKNSATRLINAYGGILSRLNYNEYEKFKVADIILNNENSYLKRGYNVAFSGYIDKNGEHQMALIAYEDKYKERTLKELLERKEPTKALIQKLPAIENDLLDGGIRTIKTGGVRHLDSTYIKSFYSNKDNKYIAYIDTTLTSALKGGIKFAGAIDEAVKKGDYESANKMINRNINESIFSASGTSAYQTVIDEVGKKSKQYIPKLIDTQKVINLDGVLNFLPDVLSVNSSLYTAALKDLGEDEMEGVMNYFKKVRGKNGNIEYHELRGKSGAFLEWINLNMYEGHNILGHISNFLYNTADKEIDKYTNLVVAEKLFTITENNKIAKTGIETKDPNFMVPNFIMPSSKFDSYAINTQDFFQAMPYTHLNPSRRPLKYQVLNSNPLLRNEIEQHLSETNLGISNFNELVSYFKNKKANTTVGIEIGDYARTRFNDTNYFTPMNKMTDGFFLQTFLGVKNISSSDLYDRLTEYNDNDIFNLIDSLLKDNNFNKINKYSREEMYDIVNDLLTQYKSGGLTKEQHSLLSPALADTIYFKEDLKTIQTDESNFKRIIEKGKLENGDILQTYTLNGKNKNKKYTGVTRIIEDYNPENFKLFTSKEERTLNNRKIFIGSSEKTVTNPIIKSTITNKNETYIAQRLFEDLFGENVGIVGLYGYTKHESGSAIIGSRLNIITQSVLNNLDTSRNKEAVDIFNMFKDIMGEEYGYEIKSDIINNIKYTTSRNPHNINSKTNIFEQLREINTSLEEMANNNNTLARDILNTFDYFDKNNLLYEPATMAPLLLEYKSSGSSGENGGNISSRELQVRGQSYNSLSTMVERNGQFERIAKASIQHDKNYIKDNPRYKKGMFNLTALVEATKAQYTEAKAPGTGSNVVNGKVTKLNLKDIRTKSKSKTLNAQTIQDTIFGKYPDTTVFEIDLGDIFVVNPFKQLNDAKDIYGNNVEKINGKMLQQATEEALTNKIFIANSKALVMDDNTIFMSESMKNVTSLLNRIIEYSEDGSHRKHNISQKEQFKRLNDSISEYYGSLIYELNNKNGIKEQVLNRASMQYTMTSLSTGIVEFNFLNDEKTQIKHGFSDKFINIVDGKPVFSDVAIMSKDDIFGNFGLTRETVAKQILEDNLGNKDYKLLINKNSSLKQELINRGYLNKNKELNILSFEDWFEKNKSSLKDIDDKEINIKYTEYFTQTKTKLQNEIADYYVENIGIKGIESRHPLFSSEGTAYVRYYGSPYVERGSIIYGESESKRKNGDIDGDTQAVRLFLEEDKKGRTKIMNDNNEIIKEWYNMQNVQNAQNEIYYFDQHRETDKTPDISIDSYEKAFKEKYPNAKNTTLDAGIEDMYGAVKSGNEKKNIGYISNINFNIRDYNNEISYNMLNVNARNKNELDKIVQNAKNINKFTALTEQKLIDVKHGAEKNKTIAQKYGNIVGDLFSLNTVNDDKTHQYANKKIQELIDLLLQSSVFDGSNKDLITLENILNYKNDNKLDETTKKSVQQLRSVYSLATNHQMKDILENPFQIDYKQNSILTVSNMFDALENGTQKIGTETAKRTEEILRNALDNKILKGLSVTDDVKDKFLVSRNNGKVNLFRIKDINDNSKIGKHIKMFDYNKRDNVIYSGNSFNSIGEMLTNEGYSLIDKNEFINIFENEFKEQKDLSDMVNILNDLDKSDKSVGLLKYRMAEYNDNMDLFGSTVTSKDFIKTKNNSNDLRRKNKNLSKAYDNLASILGDNLDVVSDISNQISEIYSEGQLTNSVASSLISQMNEEIINRAKNKNDINVKEIYNNILKQYTDNILNPSETYLKDAKYKNTYSVNEINKNMIKERNDVIYSILNNEDYKVLDRETVKGLANAEYSKKYKEIIAQNEKNITNNTLLYYKDYIKGKESLGWDRPVQDRIIGFGEYSNAYISDLSIEELNNILKDNRYNVIKLNADNKTIQTDITDMVNESKNNIREFIKLVNYDSEIYYNSIGNIKKHNTGKNFVIDVNDINETIIERAKEKKEELLEKEQQKIKEKVTKKIETESTEKIGEKLSKNKKIALSVAGGLLGLAIISGVGNRQMHVDNTRDNNEQNEKNIRKKEKQEFFNAPKSNPTTYMDNGGVSINVKGKAKRGVNTEDISNNIGNAISGATGQNVNLNINQTDDRENVDKNWLQRKFNSLMY